MPTDGQKQTLTNAVSLIRSAELLLVQAGNASADPLELGKINLQYSHIDSFLSQLLHAQATADDAVFAGAVVALRQQSASLQAQEEQIRTIVADVGQAAQIVGYIAQALTSVATL